MPIPAPTIHRFHQTSADKRFTLMSGAPPAAAGGETRYRIYFNREPGLPSSSASGAVVITLDRLDPPGAPGDSWTATFHAPELECAVYYVCIRSVNPLTGEESGNTNQRITPVCELLRDPITVVAHGPNGAVYTRDPEPRENQGQPARLLRSMDHGASWEALCAMPGDSGLVPGFAVDSKGYLYAAASPTPLISRDDGLTFQPMSGPHGEPVNLAHATEFWYPAWNVTEIMPGTHPDFPDGGLFLSTYANGGARGPSDPDWLESERVWYDGEGNIESDYLGRGYRIFYSRDAERRVWEYFDITNFDHPNNPGPDGKIPLGDRHIHGFKINPYAPGDWYLSTGDGMDVAQTVANFAQFGREGWFNWVWEGDFPKRRGLYRFDSSFQSVTQLRGPIELNGPTGLAFFPDGSLLVSDDNANWEGAAGVGAGVHRYTRDGREIEHFNPSALDPHLAGMMYDAITLEGTSIAFVTLDDDSRIARSDTAILTNLNGVWETLIQLPNNLNIEMLSADSRKLIPRDARYIFANVIGLGGIRIPVGPLFPH